MNSITSPLAADGARMMAAASMAPATTPRTAGFQAPRAESVAAIVSGTATQYWDECVAFPAGSTASLWLLVDGGWRALDNPTPIIRDMVQRAFLGAGSVVRVWHDGGMVVGLVVSG